VPEPGRRFGPTVLGGLAGSGVAAFAGGRAWASPDAPDPSGGSQALIDHSGGHVPLAAALGLVALACWGVVLVTRRAVRRVVAAVAVLASGGLVATSMIGRTAAIDSARSATVDLGGAGVGVHTTAWWWVGLLASLVALAASGVAVRLCPGWPEMGSRYDAPVRRPTTEEMSEVDLWRAIDRGHDPTDSDH
jgi:Tryptophan-associated transmembrane protein (Trp_oprn_chp)